MIVNPVMLFGQVVRVTYSILLGHDPGNLRKGLWVDSQESGLLSNNSAKSKYNTISKIINKILFQQKQEHLWSNKIRPHNSGLFSSLWPPSFLWLVSNFEVFSFSGSRLRFSPQTHKLYSQEILKFPRHFKEYELDFESRGRS